MGGGGEARSGADLLAALPLGSAANKTLTFALRQPERRAGYWVKALALNPNAYTPHIMLACVKEQHRENL